MPFKKYLRNGPLKGYFYSAVCLFRVVYGNSYNIVYITINRVR